MGLNHPISSRLSGDLVDALFFGVKRTIPNNLKSCPLRGKGTSHDKHGYLGGYTYGQYGGLISRSEGGKSVLSGFKQ